MKITITKDDIQNGIGKNINWCPLALAARREFNSNVMVDGTRLYVFDDRNIETKYELPQDAIDWVGNFDNGKPVNPATFEIWELVK